MLSVRPEKIPPLLGLAVFNTVLTAVASAVIQANSSLHPITAIRISSLVRRSWGAESRPMAGISRASLLNMDTLCPCRRALTNHSSPLGQQLAARGTQATPAYPYFDSARGTSTLAAGHGFAQIGQLADNSQFAQSQLLRPSHTTDRFSSLGRHRTQLALLGSTSPSAWPNLPPGMRHLSSISAVATGPRTSSSVPAVMEPKSRGKAKLQEQEGKSARSVTESEKAAVVDTRPLSPFPTDSQGGFDSLGLSPPLLEQLREVELTTATDVQVAAIPVLLQGHDAALQSYTGSGKTLAYLLPVLSMIGPLAATQDRATGGSGAGEQGGKPVQGIQAVIVAPSRELAMQIVREAERILGPEKKKAVQQLIGGANQQRQEEALKKLKPPIVVGTPGRISDLSRAGRLQTHGCRWLVLDEADALLSHKFRLDMLRILEHVGHRRAAPGAESATGRNRTERQTVLVSATMPPAVLEAATRWGHRPLLVRASGVGPLAGPSGAQQPAQGAEGGGGRGARAGVEGIRESLPPNLDHRFIVAPQRHKVDVVRKCIHALGARSVIVFMNYGRRLKDTEFKLGARSIAAGNLHGGMDKVTRANVLAAFREGKLRVLVVSEVAARGLDVLECDLVINLEMPTDGAHYAHRAGRTGRLGRGGTVITICEEPEAFVVDKFARQLGIGISRAEVVEGNVLPYEGRMRY